MTHQTGTDAKTELEKKWQRQLSIAAADYRDEYRKLLERLRQLGRSAQTNESTRRLAQRAYFAITQLRDDLAREIRREEES